MVVGGYGSHKRSNEELPRLPKRPFIGLYSWGNTIRRGGGGKWGTEEAPTP